MRTRTTLYAKTVWLSSFFLLTAFAICASAQSGRVIPTPTPTPVAEQPSEEKPEFVPDPNRERYKFIFPTDYERKFVTDKKGKEHQDYDGTRHAFFEDLVARINQAGEKGYRLLSMHDEEIAIVERSDAQYEYAWFETNGGYSGFQTAFGQLSKKGFRLVYHSLIYRYCESNDPEHSWMGETCVQKDFFLVEREKGVETPREYWVAASLPRWRISKIAPAMTSEVKEKIGRGFYPVGLISNFEVLLEKTNDADARPSQQRDLQIVRSASFWGNDNLRKNVGEFAQQGYRLELVDNQIAVMCRDGSSASPVSYVWLDAGGKKGRLEQELAKLEAGGAVFRMTYPDSTGVERTIIFETGAPDGKRREYRALTLEVEEMNKPPDKKAPLPKIVKSALTPESKEAWAELNRLVEEGFVVRTLFHAGKQRVLLERTR